MGWGWVGLGLSSGKAGLDEERKVYGWKALLGLGEGQGSQALAVHSNQHHLRGQCSDSGDCKYSVHSGWAGLQKWVCAAVGVEPVLRSRKTFLNASNISSSNRQN